MTFMCVARVFRFQTYCVNTSLVVKKHAIPHLSEELNNIDMVFLIIDLAISIMEC